MTHTPVLLHEVLRVLAPAAGETYVDLTAGRGGHARAMARALGPAGHEVLLDVDAGNLAHAAEQVAGEGTRVTPIRASFAEVGRHLMQRNLRAHLVLADLGFSSTQMDDPSRGFSFLRDGPLDMRLDTSGGETAADLVARLSERELADVIYQLGEDPFARRIARAIVAQRERQALCTTAQMAEIVRQAYGSRARDSRMHPATRTFMALRILVNDELGALRMLLSSIADAARAAAALAPSAPAGWLEPGARVAVISFHSLEDRLVKHAFADLEKAGFAERLTRKPIEAGEAEVAENTRARSAKMRAIRLVSPEA